MILNVSKNDTLQNDFLETIKILSKNCFIPITVGGNINSEKIADQYIKNGADKILINSLIYNDPITVQKISNRYGQANIIAGIDFVKNKKNQNIINIAINHGSKIIEHNLYEWINIISNLDIGEILLQSIDNDGTGNGLFNNFDDQLISKIYLPIILMGGIGNYQQIIDGFNKNNINAISTANILNFIGDSFNNTRNLLYKNNINLPKWNLDEFENLRNKIND